MEKFTVKRSKFSQNHLIKELAVFFSIRFCTIFKNFATVGLDLSPSRARDVYRDVFSLFNAPTRNFLSWPSIACQLQTANAELFLQQYPSLTHFYTHE